MSRHAGWFSLGFEIKVGGFEKAQESNAMVCRASPHKTSSRIFDLDTCIHIQRKRGLVTHELNQNHREESSSHSVYNLQARSELPRHIRLSMRHLKVSDN